VSEQRYPSRFVSGRTVAVHLRLPHLEHRNRLTTSDSKASHPAIAARVWGRAVRLWPHSHVMWMTYCPNESTSDNDVEWWARWITLQIYRRSLVDDGLLRLDTDIAAAVALLREIAGKVPPASRIEPHIAVVVLN